MCRAVFVCLFCAFSVWQVTPPPTHFTRPVKEFAMCKLGLWDADWQLSSSSWGNDCVCWVSPAVCKPTYELAALVERVRTWRVACRNGWHCEGIFLLCALMQSEETVQAELLGVPLPLFHCWHAMSLFCGILSQRYCGVPWKEFLLNSFSPEAWFSFKMALKHCSFNINVLFSCKRWWCIQKDVI